MPRFNLDAVRSAAAGRWPDVIAALAGVSPEILDGAHHPCPKCGGRDRFNFARDGSGGAFCNQCGGRGDGFATIGWLTGETFKETLPRVADHLGIKPEPNQKKDPHPLDYLELSGWSDIKAALWCKLKPPIAPEAIKAVGGQFGRYRGEFSVLALPVWQDWKREGEPVGWVIYRANGGTLPTGRDRSGEPVKVKTVYGSKPGILTAGIEPDSTAPIWKTEGPSDLLAMLSVNPGTEAFTNSNGAGEQPSDDMIAHCKGRRVFVMHDADRPGQEGATWKDLRGGKRRPGWCPLIAEVAEEVRNVTLPFPIEFTHGTDLRDFLNGGGTFAGICRLADESETWTERAGDSDWIDEADDDPERLARVNLERYRDDHGGRLVFWRDEWWKYREGRYRSLGPSELRAKVTRAIRVEFERCWREGKDKGEKRPVKKVSRSLVNNVIGSMESLCLASSSVTMPSLLSNRSKPHYVSATNGIIDIEALIDGRKGIDEVLLPHSDDWFSTFRLDYAFDLEAECPLWLAFLNRAMQGDQHRIALLQEWAGYLLTPDNRLQKFLALEGEGGNGKTVYFAGITAMLGEDNVSHVGIESFHERFSLGTTVGKAANISGDTGTVDYLAEGVLKQYTGGDIMHFDRKNLSPISVRPTAKLMASWNGRPKIRDRSDGLWRRMLLVPFDYPPKAHEKIVGMDDPEWWIANGEAPGILLWAMAGLNRLRDRGEFLEPDATRAAMQDYREDSNPALEFLAETLERDSVASVNSSHLYGVYSEWTKSQGYPKPLNCRQFGKEIRKFFPGVDRVRRREGGILAWFYEGIRYREGTAIAPEDEEKFF